MDSSTINRIEEHIRRYQNIYAIYHRLGNRPPLFKQASKLL